VVPDLQVLHRIALRRAARRGSFLAFEQLARKHLQTVSPVVQYNRPCSRTSFSPPRVANTCRPRARSRTFNLVQDRINDLQDSRAGRQRARGKIIAERVLVMRLVDPRDFLLGFRFLGFRYRTVQSNVDGLLIKAIQVVTVPGPPAARERGTDSALVTLFARREKLKIKDQSSFDERPFGLPLTASKKDRPKGGSSERLGGDPGSYLNSSRTALITCRMRSQNSTSGLHGFGNRMGLTSLGCHEAALLPTSISRAAAPPCGPPDSPIRLRM
jgi:hypothetical protein